MGTPLRSTICCLHRWSNVQKFPSPPHREHIFITNLLHLPLYLEYLCIRTIFINFCSFGVKASATIRKVRVRARDCLSRYYWWAGRRRPSIRPLLSIRENMAFGITSTLHRCQDARAVVVEICHSRSSFFFIILITYICSLRGLMVCPRNLWRIQGSAQLIGRPAPQRRYTKREMERRHVGKKRKGNMFHACASVPPQLSLIMLVILIRGQSHGIRIETARIV